MGIFSLNSLGPKEGCVCQHLNIRAFSLIKLLSGSHLVSVNVFKVLVIILSISRALYEVIISQGVQITDSAVYLINWPHFTKNKMVARVANYTPVNLKKGNILDLKY